jgi:hypothetical protein
VDGGAGEVGEAAGVVGVEVGQDQVGDGVGVDALALELAASGVGLVELEAGEGDRGLADAGGGVADVFEADPGVDQREAGGVAEEEAVAADPGVRGGVEPAGVEVLEVGHRRGS